MISQDPFAILHIDRTDSEVVIRKAWRERARQVHPDVGGSDAAMQELNEALHSALELISCTPTPVTKVRSSWSRRERDVSSFTVDVLPAECFEALVIVAGMSGAISVEEPPYHLEFSLHDSDVQGGRQGWCQCDLVPEAGATTVSLLVGTSDNEPSISVEEVRDYLVASLNSIEWPN